MEFEYPPEIKIPEFDDWARRFVDTLRVGEFEMQSINVTNYASINQYRLGQVGSWDITETTIQNGTIIIDSAQNRITVDTIILDGAENEIRIGGSDLVLDADTQTIRVQTGANYVEMSPSGFVGVDSVLGTTFNIPTDGSAPSFSSGIIREAIYEVYTSGVIKTAADPTSTGGMLINNQRLAAYDDTPTKLLEFIYSGTNKGDGYIGDYDGGNDGIKYDHSAGVFYMRGSINVSGSLTLSATGSITISASDQLIIESGGSMLIETGGAMTCEGGTDIKMYGDGTDPGEIRFYDTSDDLAARFGSDSADSFSIIPGQDGYQDLDIGTNGYTSTKRYWQDIRLLASTYQLYRTYDTVDECKIEMTSTNMDLFADSNMTLTADVDITIDAGDDVIVDSSDNITLTATDNIILTAGNNVNITGTIRMLGTMFIEERSAKASYVAGFGQLWVKNTNPCELWFTDDLGSDTKLA